MTRLNRIQAPFTRGVRARIRRVAGCAPPTDPRPPGARPRAPQQKVGRAHRRFFRARARSAGGLFTRPTRSRERHHATVMFDFEKGFLIVKGCERRIQIWTGSIRSRRLFEWLSLAASAPR